jgi:hypothetical protein
VRASATRFLVAVLGRTGATALAALAKADPSLAGYVVPRAALAWLGHVGATIDLPGVPEGAVALSKSDTGFDGAVVIDGTGYNLAKADAATVATALSLAVGVTPALAPGLRDRDLAKLGHTIELLAKAQARKPEIEGTGHAAAAIAPTAPTPPTPTAPNSNNRSALKIPMKPRKPEGAPKPRTAPLALSEADEHRKCSACGASQFSNGKFRGCYCIRNKIAKSIDAVQAVTGRWTVNLGRLQPDEAELVIELFKGRADGG